MKKLLIITLPIILALLFLSSCKNTGAPSGMQIASDTSKVEYNLFVPDGWIIDSMDTVSSAHASDSDRTGVSVKKNNVKTVDEWWTSYKNAISTTFDDLKILSEGEDTILDKLNAKKFIFTASFNKSSYYKYEIIAVERGGCVYEIMIKYQGIVKNGELSYSDKGHAKSIKKVLENFSFNDTLSEKTEVSYEADNTPEGMKCASNSKIVDYYLFVPNGWIVEKTSGAVSSAYVSEKDKTNVSVMQWNYTGNYEKWWNEYLLQLYSAFDYNAIPLDDRGVAITDENGLIKFNQSSVITINTVAGDEKIDNVSAKKYTYSVKTDGEVYDFSVFAIVTRASVYVITFTFKQGNDMSLYTEDVDKILKNFRFI